MESSYLRAAMALSTAGMLLVPVFGLLIRFQPRFVHGLQASAGSAEVNCYVVGGLYGGVFLACALLLLLQSSRGCHGKKEDAEMDDVTRRNRRYGLPFEELESKEFVRAMDALDRRTAVHLSTTKKQLELPTKFPDKIDAV